MSLFSDDEGDSKGAMATVILSVVGQASSLTIPDFSLPIPASGWKPDLRVWQFRRQAGSLTYVSGNSGVRLEA